MDIVLDAISDGPIRGANDNRNDLNDTVKCCEDNCNKLLFSDLCKKFEEVEKTSGSEKKFVVIFNKGLKNYLAGQSMYPLMRLVLPSIDTERGKYGLKQTAISSIYVEALKLDKHKSKDAQALINWKDPSKNQGSDASKITLGDYCSILESVLKTRVRSEFSEKSIGDVNKILDNLAIAHGKEEKVAVIRDQIINHFCSIEQKWLMRIVFQDLKIGLKYEAVMNYLSPTALQRYNECTNLRTVCEDDGGDVELTGLRPFVDFKPMLAKGFLKAESSADQLTSVHNAMKGQPFAMDIKLDGERMMIHIRNGKMMMFTRNGSDYTDAYRQLGETVRNCISSAVSDCILDGEVCAWNQDTKSFMRFGHNAEAGREERESYDLTGPESIAGKWLSLNKWLVFIVFDIVYIDGPEILPIVYKACDMFKFSRENDKIRYSGEITHFPLIVRREILKTISSFIDNRYEFIKHKVVVSPDVSKRRELLEDYFNEVTIAGEEGLVVKNLASTYELGLQSKALGLWVKMKPEYGSHIQELDVVLLGGYYGEGKSMRGQGVSTFLIGVKNDMFMETDDMGNIFKDPFLCCGKVGTGYSFEELAELRTRLDEIAVPWDPTKMPAHLAHWQVPRSNRPNVYYPVDKSIVVELKCAELVDSVVFTAGMTCRFPRISRIRYDKPVSDILTVSELREIKSRLRQQSGLNARAGGSGQDSLSQSSSVGDAPKGRKGRSKDLYAQVNSTSYDAVSAKRSKRTIANTVDSMFRVSNEVVLKKGYIFENMAFCILDEEFNYDSLRSFSKDEISKAIRSQGGLLVASVRPDVIIIAGSRRTYRVKEHIKKGENDVVDFKYIIECLQMGEKLPMNFGWLLGCSKKTELEWLGKVDICGDQYSEEFDCEAELSQVLERIDAIVPNLNLKTDSIDNSSEGIYRYSLRTRKREIACVIEEHSCLNSVSWRQIVGILDDDELGVVQCPQNSALNKNFVVFVDPDSKSMASNIKLASTGNIHSALASSVTQNTFTRDMCLEALRTRLALHGCMLADELSPQVTHLVYSELNPGRAEILKAKLAELNHSVEGSCYTAEVVSSSWAEMLLKIPSV